MSRADDAVMRLYESADLRDELTDEEADHLLKWAEGEIARLDQSTPDDAAFDAQVGALMDLIKGVNRYAGRQGQMSAQAADPLPADIAAQAVALGRPASAEQVAAAGTGDPAGTIAALTALLGSAPQPSTPAAVTRPAAEMSHPAPNPPTSDPSFGDTDL